MGGSLEKHYQCYLQMVARLPVAILIVGGECCDSVSGSGLPSLPGRTSLGPLVFAVVEDTEMCFVSFGSVGRCGFPVSAYKRNLKKMESCLWWKTSTVRNVLNLT